MRAPLQPQRPLYGRSDDPFEMLETCHDRVRRALIRMEWLAARLPVHGCDATTAQSARDVMHHFDLVAPAHHEDEERHILPLLRAAGDDAFAAQIEQEHHELHRLWIELRRGLAEVAAGTWIATGPAEFVIWAKFAALYRAHIAAEEAVAFPAARAALDPAAMEAICREMAERRGLA
ncbi:MAG TPA: hemerythrin domain-containing protein [Rubrivivax sp.]|nr:hemerythrin domain-containing protein [Burkholderiales bacterium]HNT39055.1 hemerythrin domain-containing protein [Rubrivivax sp.]